MFLCYLIGVLGLEYNTGVYVSQVISGSQAYKQGLRVSETMSIYCIAQYCTVLHGTVLYCMVLHCTARYCTVLYCR